MTGSVRVLYFDDPGKPTDAVAGSLRQAGYHVEQVHALADLEDGLARREASVLVLDISTEDDRAERIPAMVARHDACELTTVYFILPHQRSPTGSRVIALKRPIASPALLRVLEHAISSSSQVDRLPSPPANEPTLPALTVPPSLAASPGKSRKWLPLLLLAILASGVGVFALPRSRTVAPPVSANATRVAPTVAGVAPQIEAAPPRPQPPAAPEPLPLAPVAAPVPTTEVPGPTPPEHATPTPEPSSEPAPGQPRPRAKQRVGRRHQEADAAPPAVADDPPPPAPPKPDPLVSAPESNPYKRGR